MKAKLVKESLIENVIPQKRFEYISSIESISYQIGSSGDEEAEEEWYQVEQDYLMEDGEEEWYDKRIPISDLKDAAETGYEILAKYPDADALSDTNRI